MELGVRDVTGTKVLIWPKISRVQKHKVKISPAGHISLCLCAFLSQYGDLGTPRRYFPLVSTPPMPGKPVIVPEIMSFKGIGSYIDV